MDFSGPAVVHSGVADLTASQSSMPGTAAESADSMFVVALNHTWGWVEARSSQRIQIINFYLLSVAFASAAYGTTLSNNLNDVAGAIGIAGILLSLASWRSDVRARELLQAGEKALLELQDQLARWTHMNSLRMLEAVDKSRSPWRSLSTLISLMYGLATVLFSAAAVYGFAR